MLDYHEADNLRRLRLLDRTRTSAFAAACAQRLLPLFGRYAAAVRTDPSAVEGAVAHVWKALSGSSVDLAPVLAAVERQIPDEDDSWTGETAYGQSAAACAAYAVRTWLTGDAQEACWASRQVFDLSDYAAQRLLPDVDPSTRGSHFMLLHHQVVQTALAGIENDLQAVEPPDLDLEQLAHRAATEGRAWSDGLP